LAAVHGTYTEGFTTPDLMDARALLESLPEDDAGRARAGPKDRMQGKVRTDERAR